MCILIGIKFVVFKITNYYINTMNLKYHIQRNNVNPQAGCLLISEPLLQDSFFKRSVVLLIEHSQSEGTVGVMLNKPLEVNFNQIVQDSPELQSQMFLGGPVQMDNVYFLHTLGNEIEQAIRITDGLYWGGNIETVNKLINLKVLNTTNIRFFIGYSGWQPGQLDDELQRNNWAVLMPHNVEFWNIQPFELWKYTVRKLGTEYKFWANLPHDPQLN
jgi:putative transcriptional regulator